MSRQNLRFLPFDWAIRTLGRMEFSMEDYDTLEDYSGACNLLYGRLVSSSLALLIIIFFPFDFFTLADWPKKLWAMNVWKITMVTLLFFTYVMLLRVKKPESFSFWRYAATMGLLSIFLCGIQGTDVGPLSEPWFYGYIFLPFVSVLAIMDLKWRLLLNSLLLLLGLLGIAVASPEHFAFEFFPNFMAWLIISLALGTGSGHVFDTLMRENFKRSLELREHNENLAREVKKRTQEATQAMLHLEVIQEQVRQELARELHDELGHLIVLHSLSLQRYQAEHGADPKVIEAFEAFLVEVEDIEQGARRIVRELRSGMALKGTLADLLEKHLQTLAKGANVELEWLVEPEELQLNEEVGFVLSRVIQEAFNNIRKHANATKVEVSVFYDLGLLKASVRDNGKGFDTSAVPSGYGLHGMRERVESLKGTLDITSQATRGTELVLKIPYYIEGEEDEAVERLHTLDMPAFTGA